MTAPTSFEQQLWNNNKPHIAGIDEVGRGAWAGPLVVAAVVFPPHFSTTLPIYDSKKVSKKLREEVSKHIVALATTYAIIEVGLDIINEKGIGYAEQYGFSQAITALDPIPDHVLVDAFTINEFAPKKQTAIIKGDQLSLSIAAASIIAKVYRDHLMQDLHKADPRYGFEQHVGYGTKSHRDAIKQHGLSTHHRSSFNLQKWV